MRLVAQRSGMLSDATAVVTGGANGIGREIALTFADNGATVVVADVVREARDDATPTDELVDDATRGTFVETDVSDPDAVAALFEAVDREYGGLDVLVNNAAVFRDAPVLDLDLNTWQGMIAVTQTGTFLCCKHALPLLRDGGGSITTISSVAGLQATSERPAYAATKAAITNLMRQIAVDYGPDGVRANSIHPGPVDTSSTTGLQDTEKWQAIRASIPLGRFARPDDVANAALYLASEMGAYINGHALVVDGGLTAFYH